MITNNSLAEDSDNDLEPLHFEHQIYAALGRELLVDSEDGYDEIENYQLSLETEES